MNNLFKPQVFSFVALMVSELFAETFSAPLQSFVWRLHIGTVLVYQYCRRKSTKTSGDHFCYKSSFFCLEN